MKHKIWNFKFSETERQYWRNELQSNRKFFLLMYALVIVVEVAMAISLTIFNSISTIPNYDTGYYIFYFAGIANAIVSMALIYFCKKYIRHIQIFCLYTLMVWATLFTVYDINLGGNGYILSQIIVLAATSIRFPGRIHFSIHIIVFLLYSILLMPLPMDSSLLVSNIVNTGLLFLFASLIIVYSNRIRIQNFKNTLIMEQQQKQLLHMAQYDGLTELFSRRTILNYLEDVFGIHTIGCIMTDIDDFKRYNDEFGHRTGDEVLRQSALLLNNIITQYGAKAGRYGGEEFFIVVPNCNEEKLKTILESLQSNFQEPADEHTITLSIGGTLSIENDTIDSLITRADKAMYRAKNAGKATYRIL